MSSVTESRMWKQCKLMQISNNPAKNYCQIISDIIYNNKRQKFRFSSVYKRTRIKVQQCFLSIQFIFVSHYFSLKIWWNPFLLFFSWVLLWLDVCIKKQWSTSLLRKHFFVQYSQSPSITRCLRMWQEDKGIVTFCLTFVVSSHILTVPQLLVRVTSSNKDRWIYSGFNTDICIVSLFKSETSILLFHH